MQYLAGSLDPHLAGGRPWDLDRTRGGYRRVVPQQGDGSDAEQASRRATRTTWSGCGTRVVATEIFVYETPTLLTLLGELRACPRRWSTTGCGSARAPSSGRWTPPRRTPDEATTVVVADSRTKRRERVAAGSRSEPGSTT